MWLVSYTCIKSIYGTSDSVGTLYVFDSITEIHFEFYCVPWLGKHPNQHFGCYVNFSKDDGVWVENGKQMLSHEDTILPIKSDSLLMKCTGESWRAVKEQAYISYGRHSGTLFNSDTSLFVNTYNVSQVCIISENI